MTNPLTLLDFLLSFMSNCVSSLIGTVVGAILAYLFAQRQFKIQKEVETWQKQIETALEYHQEMTSSDFSFARAEARKVFEQHSTAKNLDEFYSDLSEEEKKYIRIVTAYFRRLQLAIEYEQIDKQMVIDLLSGEFLWWYFRWLNQMIPGRWETRKNIDRLHHWLRNTMPAKKYEQSKNENDESVLPSSEKDSG